MFIHKKYDGKEAENMKKRVKGLLAFWLCMLMLFGSSMAVFANEYDLFNINKGDIFVTGDVIDADVSSGGVYYVDFEEEVNLGGGKHNVKDGTWKCIERTEVAGYPKLFLKAVATGENMGETAQEPSKSARYTCDHDMQYEIYRKPTEEVDGLWRYGCTKCTHTEGFVPICGMGAFFERAINTINGAEVNGTVTIATPKWMSFNKDVYDALAARPDVTVNVHFRYQGQFYAVTIPAGTDMTPYLTEDGYCGFLKLAALFGVTAIQTEE